MPRTARALSAAIGPVVVALLLGVLLSAGAASPVSPASAATAAGPASAATAPSPASIDTAPLPDAPMPLEPLFETTSADHVLDAERSVIGVEFAPGSAHLDAAGEITVRDYSGTAISRATVATEIPAHDATRVQVMLDAALEPGRYTVEVMFTDSATGETATGGRLPFSVSSAERFVAMGAGGPGLLPYAIGAIACLVALALILILRVFSRRIGRALRRRRRLKRRREAYDRRDRSAD